MNFDYHGLLVYSWNFIGLAQVTNNQLVYPKINYLLLYSEYDKTALVKEIPLS